MTKKDAAEETYQQLTTFDSILRGLNATQSREKDEKVRKEEKRKKSKKRKHLEKEEKEKKSRKRNHPEKDEKGKKSKKRKHPKEPFNPILSGRLAHRKKFITNKCIDQYSEIHLKEILGVSSRTIDRSSV